jgi:hypothetical protein
MKGLFGKSRVRLKSRQKIIKGAEALFGRSFSGRVFPACERRKCPGRELVERKTSRPGSFHKDGSDVRGQL